MNNLQVFSNSKFGQVRTLEENGKVLFGSTDIAMALGYTNPHKAIRDHCKGVTKRSVLTEGGNQEVNFIPEGDIYRLAAKSELPGAEEFESWIFDEVIPSIRKHGAYMTPETIEKTLSNPDFIIQLATKLKEHQAELAAQKQYIKALEPKAEFFDAVADSKTAIEIGEAAKVLNMGIGRNKLFHFLRQQSILMANNQPYQEYIDRGYFRTIEQKYTKPDGTTCISIKSLVYQRGLDYIRKLLDKQKLA